MRIIFPVLCVMVFLGAGFYFFVLRSISDFSEARIGEDLERDSRQVYGICDSALQSLLMAGLGKDEVAARIKRGKTVGEIEDYLQHNNLKAIIYTGQGENIFLSKELSADFFSIISRVQEKEELQLANLDDKVYYVRYFQFEIWDWHIILLKNGKAYQSLIDKVLISYVGTGAVLLIASLLLLYYLKRAIQNPINSILTSIRSGSVPQYRGIEEFEFLSDTIRDATQKQLREQQRISYQATHDPLTNILNRRAFEHHLELLLKKSDDSEKHTLIYLDLDQFKIVNDTCGHTAGDELLRQLTRLLKGKLRHNDILARLGGDEFGVILESCQLESATNLAEVLRLSVHDFRFRWQDKLFSIGASIGLVNFSSGVVTIEDILRMADAACYAAKDKGRNRVHVYNPDDSDLTRRRQEMGWIGRINRALDEDRFVLYTQGIISISGKEENIKRHEFLLRMKDEQGNIIAPGAFIPAAERYNLMPMIDRWVIKNAFAYCQYVYARKDPQICGINLSGASVGDENLLVFIKKQFELYGIPPSLICFEITETSAISNLPQAKKLISALRAIGCCFALDDFGSGTSSYGYLKQLPVDFLKIDGNFVKNIVNDPVDMAMVDSINHIGHVMGIKTIAEFVEDENILEALKKIGVDYAQGYGIDRPHPLFEKDAKFFLKPQLKKGVV